MNHDWIDWQTILLGWVVGAVLGIAAILHEAGGWEGLVEEMEDEEPGYILHPELAALLILLLCLFAWPFFFMEAIRRRLP